MTTELGHLERASPPTSDASGNIARHLPLMGERTPDRCAVIHSSPASRGRGTTDRASLTFRELEAQSNRYAHGLTAAGIERGTRVLVMVRPGPEFLALIFALFKMGAVPVLIDPGMGVRRLLECIRDVQPDALIGVPAAHAVRRLRPAAFRSVRTAVTVGRRWLWGGPTLRGLERRSSATFETVTTRADDTAAILFTSGATGPAKGVVYEHGMFDAQVVAIRDAYGIEPGEIDLPTFPLFGLFSVALGMTCVIPNMDPSRPARVDPSRIVSAIRDHGVTNSFGSPALWERVSRYCVKRGVTLPTLRRVLIAGAPVPSRLIERMHRVLVAPADVHTPYGATESMPVSTITGHTRLAAQAAAAPDAGICVGKPLPGVAVRVIPITDEPIGCWEDDRAVPPGRVGEIIVRARVVTRSYCDRPVATTAAKIPDGGAVWHRMGDAGYMDSDGNLWYCGRTAHRVETAAGPMYSVPSEGVFNQHPAVTRSALVGIGPRGHQRPILVVEPERRPGRTTPSCCALARELLDLAREHDATRPIERVLFHRRFPVDVRHNAKIDRGALAAWAERRFG